MIPSVILMQLVRLAYNWDALKMGARKIFGGAEAVVGP